MSLTELITQTAVTFVAATVGVLFASFLTRKTERFKHLQELRSAAYTDFVLGVATVAEQGGGRARVADARARIAIYGGKAVVLSLSRFIALGGQTLNAEGMRAFAELCTTMRAETGRDYVPQEDIARLLFG